MTRSTATKFGLASVLALPILAVAPAIFVLLFRPHSEPDFFYFALAGFALSFVLSLPAVKARWWWIFSPITGLILTLIIFLMAKALLILLK